MLGSQAPFSLPKSQRKVHYSPCSCFVDLIDRLDTIRLSQALAVQKPSLSTRIRDLDEALSGGISLGQITEVYGCPGSGKTTFGLHLAAQIIQEEEEGNEVVWLEGSQPLPASRLRDFIAQDHEEDNVESEEMTLQRVKCLATPTMTSLLSLLSPAPDATDPEALDFVTEKTRMLVLDDLTTLYNTAFPPTENHRDVNQKKTRVLTALVNRLTRIAITHNLAVVILCKLTSKITRGGPAQMEAPFGDVWSNACTTRILLYRDFHSRRLSSVDEQDLRWITVQKVGKRNIMDPKGLPIKIIGSGIVSLDLEASQPSRSQSSASQRPSSAVSRFAEPIVRQRSRPVDLEEDEAEQESTNDRQTTKRARMMAPPEPVVHAKSLEIDDSENEDDETAE